MEYDFKNDVKNHLDIIYIFFLFHEVLSDCLNCISIEGKQDINKKLVTT